MATMEKTSTPGLKPPAEVASSPSALLQWARENGVKEVDVKFSRHSRCDAALQPAHSTISKKTRSRRGLGFDGSSIRGFQSIDQSDLNLIPDPSTAFIDPIPAMPTLSLLCDVVDINGEPYARDPRGVARRAEAYLKSDGDRRHLLLWS